MIKRTILVLPLAVFVSTSTGCGWLTGDDGFFRDRSSDYRAASVEPSLKVPLELDAETIDDSYAIPPINDKTSLSDEFEVPRPEPLADDLNRDTVRINKLANQRWILIDGAPGQVWPRLRGFLSLNQLSVQRADAVNGLIETGWLQPSTEGSLQERYRLRIEQGVQRGSSEVYVLQADTRSGQNDWPEVSNNAERENLMIQSLAQYLADSAAAAAVSMLAQQAIDSSGKVSLGQDKLGKPFIKLQLPYFRAWASVGNALEKANFKIDDRNRSKQMYYLHYLDRQQDDDEPGFFASLFSWGSSKDNDPNEIHEQGIAYHLHIKSESDQAVVITIERQSGQTIEKGEAEKLLKLIKRHIT